MDSVARTIKRPAGTVPAGRKLARSAETGLNGYAEAAETCLNSRAKAAATCLNSYAKAPETPLSAARRLRASHFPGGKSNTITSACLP
jgi:hypothetical protein